MRDSVARVLPAQVHVLDAGVAQQLLEALFAAGAAVLPAAVGDADVERCRCAEKSPLRRRCGFEVEGSHQPRFAPPSGNFLITRGTYTGLDRSTATRRKQRGRHVSKSDRLGAVSDGIAIFSGMDDERPVGFEVFPRAVETPGRRRRRAAFDLEGPEPAGAGKLQHQIDFSATSGTIEARPGTRWRRRQQVLDDESLPACLRDRVASELVEVFDPEQSMDQATVTHVDLR